MKRLGYVWIGQIYTVHSNMLRSYYWGFPANYFRLCRKCFAEVVNSLGQHHPGLKIRVETASAPLRQASMGNDIYIAWPATWIEVGRIFGHRTDSCLETLPTHREVTTVGPVPYDYALANSCWKAERPCEAERRFSSPTIGNLSKENYHVTKPMWLAAWPVST